MNDDYTQRSWQAAFALIALLVAVSFIPPQRLGGVTLRRANILSQLHTFDDAPEAETGPDEALDEEFTVDLEEVAATVAEHHRAPAAEERPGADAPAAAGADTLAPDTLPTLLFRWEAQPVDTLRVSPDTVRLLPGLVPVEHYGDDSLYTAFCRAVADTARTRPVRIAVLGDSFIEGDILTADLRAEFQRNYGGAGCGFAPMASPLTAFRRTVKTRSEGWTSYNIMQRRTTPASLQDDYIVSGWVCRPADGAQTEWSGSDFRPALDRCTAARVRFLSRGNSRITLTLNDSLTRSFDVEASDILREVLVTGDIRKLAFRVGGDVGSFVGYGASFEDAAGVVVDNYSIRSNSGHALFGTSAALNARLNASAPYDLVVLQYGLNVMQEGVTRYTAYTARLEQMIAYVRQCFPTAAVLVLSVSDRSVKSERGYTSMSSAPSMVEAQREAARRTGASFWSTYDAMKAQGGMATFVARGWAGKDYTHINYGGGRQVGRALYDALNHDILLERRRRAEELRYRAARLDSVRLHTLIRPLSVPAPMPPTP